MKRPFQIGDKVKVLSFPFRRFGEVVQIYDGAYGVLKIRLKRKSMEQLDIEYLDAFPQQCRHLKPKPNKACTRSHPHDGPCMGKKEARRVWTTERSMSDIDKGRMSLFWNHQPALNDEVEFREVLPGEVVVTRETLAKAWEEMVDKPMPIQFDFLAKSLGLEVKP